MADGCREPTQHLEPARRSKRMHLANFQHTIWMQRHHQSKADWSQRDAGKNNPLGCFGLICIDLYCFIPDGCREPTQHLEPARRSTIIKPANTPSGMQRHHQSKADGDAAPSGAIMQHYARAKLMGMQAHHIWSLNTSQICTHIVYIIVQLF